METFEEVKNIKELDELIDKTNKYLTKLLQDRTAMKTKIIVSIVKDIYKDYLYKKEKSDKKCQNKYVKYSTIISKEDVDRFANELNLKVEYPGELYTECYDKDNDIAVRLINNNLTIFDYSIKSPFKFECD